MILCDRCGRRRDGETLRKMALAWVSSFLHPLNMWDRFGGVTSCEGCAPMVRAAIEDAVHRAVERLPGA